MARTKTQTAEAAADQVEAAFVVPEPDPILMQEPAPDAAADAAPEPEAPEPEVPPPHTPKEVPPNPSVEKRKGGVIGPLLGGVLAAGAGFGVAQYVPAGWPIADTSALEQQIQMQAATIASLKTQLSNLGGLEPRLKALERMPAPDLAPLMATLADLNGRFAAIEAAPIDGAADTADLTATVRQIQEELAALKAASSAVPANVAAMTAEAEAKAVEAEAKLQDAESAAEKIKAEAEALAQTAKSRAAFGAFRETVNSGAPFADLLPGLGLALPDGLQALAETGVPSLQSLQDSFPEAARLALESALRADMGDSWTERATNFFRSQTGARSLEPREGSDPDAVLSRAEAALAAGNVAQTLTELADLPEAAQAALADWRGKAEQHQAAQKAMNYIAGKIGE